MSLHVTQIEMIYGANESIRMVTIDGIEIEPGQIDIDVNVRLNERTEVLIDGAEPLYPTEVLVNGQVFAKVPGRIHDSRASTSAREAWERHPPPEV